MFKRLMTGLGTLPTRLLLFVALPGCLVWLALTFFRGPAPVAFRAAQATKASEVAVAPKAAPGKLEGEEARVYLEQTSEGQSLMKTLEAERFGLKWQQRAPFRGEGKGGYLGLSHDENLNAWFDEEGATIRPTVSEKERDRAWHLGLRLKSYGYGNKLKAAPPVLSRNVVENRIEYTRDGSTNPQSAGPNPKLIEWYVNKSEGIEQGFTLSGPPARQEGIAGDEPLRLVVSVTGDLRARAADDGQAVELNKNGAGVLSYSHLVASDATGRRLAARMETNEAGDEIALVVDDAEAEYPIVVDPITTTLEKKLEAEPEGQAEARFGFAVAISGDRAVVGAWREDASIPGGTIIDIGAVYNFSRSGTQWSYVRRVVSGSDGDQCGWSVAISNGGQIVSGCPGTNSSAGRAIFYDSSVGLVTNINPLLGSKAGDRFGESVAIGSNRIIVGSPFADSFGADSGSTAVYAISGSTIQPLSAFGTPGSPPNGHAGTAVAISGNLIVTGSPGSGPGKATVYDYATDSFFDLLASDGVNGDLFGNSVAISGDTVVVGAPLDDNQRGVDAGAAYVFVRNGSGQWTQQQKLMASDGHAGDFFSEHAVAIEGNTLVVGAYSNGNPLGDNSGNDDDRGAAYVFTRSGTTWTQQTKISQTNFAGGRGGRTLRH